MNKSGLKGASNTSQPLIIKPSEKGLTTHAAEYQKQRMRNYANSKVKQQEGAMQQSDSQATNNPLQTQWEGVFIPYEDYPLMALTLAQNFQGIKDTLETGAGGNTRHSIDGRGDRDSVSILRVPQCKPGVVSSSDTGEAVASFRFGKVRGTGTRRCRCVVIHSNADTKADTKGKIDVPAAGVEPATFRSGGERSNPLSYAGLNKSQVSKRWFRSVSFFYPFLYLSSISRGGCGNRPN